MSLFDKKSVGLMPGKKNDDNNLTDEFESQSPDSAIHRNPATAIQKVIPATNK